MAENITEGITYKKEVQVLVSAQALRILSINKCNVEDFLKFCLETNKISFGGHNVMLFMEKLYEDKIKNGTAPSN